MRKNEDIREAAEAAGVKMWEIAAEIGKDPSTLTKWLRFDLTPEKHETIMGAINAVIAEREQA